MLKLSRITLICIVITVCLTIAAVTQNVHAVGVMGVLGVGNANDETKKQYKTLKDANPKLYNIDCGVNDTLVYTSSHTFAGILKELDFKYIFREMQGDHSGINWRKYLTELAPLLFG